MAEVQIWEEKVTIPTYEVGQPDKNPLFFENRVYQGSSGKVYPLPISEKISNEKTMKQYQAVYLENEFLKIMILPELGGRIQRAIDKTNHYDFVYHNEVIKPALVGLVGPWISGGIEFNWPQHHRPSTYMPVEYQIEQNTDGSKTLRVGEIDQMYGTKGMASFTLLPGKAYLKIDGQLFNRTEVPQTFLWWANPAVPVNEHTYSVFPPDVNAVMDHGKRAVSTFPIATGEYYKFDYSEGIDISKYKNVPVPTSYMAAHSDFDFMGNYDEQLQAGLLHVADHHISPGKKQWTWGNADFGQAWDRNLTDENGPYIELMTGVYTDNQPDFTWLKPFEEKQFTQYFMPYKGVGHIKNATIDAALNVELNAQELQLKLYVTSAQKNLELVVLKDDLVVYANMLDLTPENFFEETVPVDFDVLDSRIQAFVRDAENNILVTFKGHDETLAAVPHAETVLPAPESLKSTEELYLAAEHLEQYRHATYQAEDYYLEGLRRDATDIRLNTGYGLLLYRRGQFAESERYLKRALTKITWKTKNPYSGEPSFNLGLVLLREGHLSESFDHFFKATWNDETKDKAYFELGKILALQGKLTDAIQFLRKALRHNLNNMKAQHMLISLLRLTNQAVEPYLTTGLEHDPLDLGLGFEQAIVTQDKTNWHQTMRGSFANYLELAIDYLEFGLIKEAKQILSDCPDENPMIDYFRGYCELIVGDLTQAKVILTKAETKQATYCFPNRLQEQQVLEALIHEFPNEIPYAKYALGNFYYDRKRYSDAKTIWLEAVEQIPDFATVNRNLSFIYYNYFNDTQRALTYIEKAFECDPTDSRILLEKDKLYENLGMSVAIRKQALERNLPIVVERDALYIVYIHLLNAMGEYQQALSLIEQHQFHPWEGGEGKISGEYKFALAESAKIAIQQDNPALAIRQLEQAKKYPDNLGEGKLPNVTDNMLDYFRGVAYEKMSAPDQAQIAYQCATQGEIIPGSVLYYNDQPADDLLYQGLAYQKLGMTKSAKRAFNQLKTYGRLHLNDQVNYDYFAVSIPETIMYQDDLQARNISYCLYLIALGAIGLGDLETAKNNLTQILVDDPANTEVRQHLEFIKDWLDD